jgi:prepilin-type N-terminal cleavage/methylation domain-containing protein
MERHPMELNRDLSHRNLAPRSRQRGMSLIELMIAMVVLAVGMGGIMVLFVTAIASNNRNKIDTAGTLVAQMTLEQIASRPANQHAPITVTDCAGTSHVVNTAVGGAALDANAAINYTAAAVAGYRMLYVTCGAGGQQATYDVRWNIQAWGATKVITVASRSTGAGQAGATPRLFALPVTLRTIAGR